MLFPPLGALADVLCYLVFDLSLHALITFGDRLSGPLGLLAWWALAWLPAVIYVSIVSARRLESKR